MTNYHRTTIGHNILYNMTTMNTMSFALCLRRVGSVASAHNHLLSFSSPFMYKLDQYFVELYDLNLG